jgi:UDP-N-acetylmuramate--alanine ligase
MSKKLTAPASEQIVPVDANARALHFIGIGGIGMSGLATIVLEKGSVQVSGSDLKTGGVIDALKQRGAHVVQGHAREHLPAAATVVVSSDIPLDNPELVEAKRRGLPIIHRSDLLKELMKDYEVLAVTGTHGKTTTTSLLSHVLFEAGNDPAFAVGGVLRNYGIQARHGKGGYFVAEADESDGTFLKYPYFGAIVTNIDTDHLAHYGSIEKLEEGFAQFVKKAPSPDKLFFCGDDDRLKRLCPRGTSYGFGPANDLRVEHVASTAKGMIFDVRFRRKLFKGIELSLHGRHNVSNAAAVFGLALTLGIPEATVRAAFCSFQGVKRRLEPKEAGVQALVFDDYAHHPTEIRATLQALRLAIGERRLVTVFQPHRPSRMKHCMLELKEAFNEADIVVTTDLYLASEPDNPEITSKSIFDLIQSSHVGLSAYYFPRTELIDRLIEVLRPHDVVLFVGAGDITKASDDLAARLKTESLQRWKVGVVYGGMNTQHGASRLSAQAVLESLDPDFYVPVAFQIDQEGRWKKTQGVEPTEHVRDSSEMFAKGVWQAVQGCDLFFPVLFGPFGEDGTIQGFFEMLNKPYIGCSSKACAVAMDKVIARQVMQASGVPVVPYIAIHRRDWKSHSSELVAEVVKKLRAPYFIKPAHLGSSVGSQRVDSSDDLQAAIQQAFTLDDKILVEQGIKGRKIEFALIGNEEISVPHPGEILSSSGPGRKCGKERTNTIPVAQLTDEQREQGSTYARKVYQALDCTGLTSVAFFLDEGGHWYFNEAVPLPAMTKENLYAIIWKEQGIAVSELMHRLIVLALSRFRRSRRQAATATSMYSSV